MERLLWDTSISIIKHPLIGFVSYRQLLKWLHMVLNLFLPEAVLSKIIIDHRQSLQYLGFLFHNISFVFSDNKAKLIVPPYLILDYKRHNILSYHFVCRMIA